VRSFLGDTSFVEIGFTGKNIHQEEEVIAF